MTGHLEQIAELNRRIAQLEAELAATRQAAAAMVVLCTDRRKRRGL